MANSICQRLELAGSNVVCIDVPDWALNTISPEYFLICKNNATMGFPYCLRNIGNNSLTPIEPGNNESNEKDSSEENDSESGSYEEYLKLVYKRKGHKRRGNHKQQKPKEQEEPSRWPSPRHKRPSNKKKPCNQTQTQILVNNLNKNFCAIYNPCKSETNITACIDLPLSVKLISKTPYLCICKGTIGYPDCKDSLNVFANGSYSPQSGKPVANSGIGAMATDFVSRFLSSYGFNRINDLIKPKNE